MGRKNAAEQPPVKDIQSLLEEVNQDLDRVKLRAKDGRIYLRALFPPKPGELEAKRSEIATGCNATISGVRLARAKAEEINRSLVLGTFDWTPYLKGRLKPFKPPESVGEWVARYEKDHWQQTQKTPTKENSYHKNYRLVFQRLPQNEPLTIELLRESILEHTAPGSRSRKGWAMAFRRLGLFAGLDEKQLRGLAQLGKGYSPKSVEPRELPTDNEILDIWSSINNESWQWVVSALAIYGLRPHELFRINTDRLNEDPPVLEVQEDSKTGFRIVYPCASSAWSEMPVTEVLLPKIDTTGKNNNQLGNKIGQEFRERAFPFTPYDLRHAYARRMFLRGFPPDFIAKSMGHSLSVQLSVYRSWWGEEVYAQKFKEVMEKWEG